MRRIIDTALALAAFAFVLSVMVFAKDHHSVNYETCHSHGRGAVHCHP